MPSFLRHPVRLLYLTWLLGRQGSLRGIGEALSIPTLVLLHKLLAPRDNEIPSSTEIGERLAATLQKLGPSFIKFGQGLATRPDLVGEETAQALALLQDRLPPFPGELARASIEKEFATPLRLLFREFDEEAIAAASIAQVHKAVTQDGVSVAVKVLRPGVEAAFTRDLAFFRWLAITLERWVPNTQRLRAMEVVRVFEESVKRELDLRFEAAAADELRENMEGLEGFRIPTVDWSRTAGRVLTLEWIEGTPIYDLPRLREAGHNLKNLAEKAAAAFFIQVFRDGFFHADLHPGNLLVDTKGDLVAVDFGIMGRLDRPTRLHLANLIHGFLTRDYKKAADAHFDAGYVPADQDRHAFAQACRSIGEPILGKPLKDISIARLLGQLFAVTERFNMHTQPQLLLLQKSLVLMEGAGRMLYPNTNMWVLAEPLIREWMEHNLGVKAQLLDKKEEALNMLKRLPQLVAKAESTLGEMHHYYARANAKDSTDITIKKAPAIADPLLVVAAVIGFLLAALVMAG